MRVLRWLFEIQRVISKKSLSTQRIKISIRKSQMTLESLSTPSCLLQKKKNNMISLMIHVITSWSNILSLLGFTFPKIHKRLHNVPQKPVISNCGLCTENISSCLDHHLQPITQKVNSYIKDINHFLRKINSLSQLPKGLFSALPKISKFVLILMQTF